MGIIMTGMLWHDKREIEEAVMGAAEYYEGKYGAKPNVCHVNPANLQGSLAISGIAIKADKTVQKECYWLGINE